MNTAGGDGFFAGLLGYEIVLLAMGVLLFLVGLWVVIQAAKKSSAVMGSLGVVCVVLSMLFVGYPSLTSFSVKNDFLELQAQFGNGETPSLSKEQQQVTAAKIEALAPRADTPQQKAIIANAYRGIGDVDKAFAIAEKVDTPGAPTAVQRALVPVFAAKLKQAVQDVPATPNVTVDAAKAAQIGTLVKKLDQSAVQLPAQTRVTIAQGYAVLGNDAKAIANIDKAQAIQRDVKIDAHLLQRLNRAPSG